MSKAGSDKSSKSTKSSASSLASRPGRLVENPRALREKAAKNSAALAMGDVVAGGFTLASTAASPPLQDSPTPISLERTEQWTREVVAGTPKADSVSSVGD